MSRLPMALALVLGSPAAFAYGGNCWDPTLTELQRIRACTEMAEDAIKSGDRDAFETALARIKILARPGGGEAMTARARVEELQRKSQASGAAAGNAAGRAQGRSSEPAPRGPQSDDTQGTDSVGATSPDVSPEARSTGGRSDDSSGGSDDSSGGSTDAEDSGAGAGTGGGKTGGGGPQPQKSSVETKKADGAIERIGKAVGDFFKPREPDDAAGPQGKELGAAKRGSGAHGPQPQESRSPQLASTVGLPSIGLPPGAAGAGRSGAPPAAQAAASAALAPRELAEAKLSQFLGSQYAKPYLEAAGIRQDSNGALKDSKGRPLDFSALQEMLRQIEEESPKALERDFPEFLEPERGGIALEKFNELKSLFGMDANAEAFEDIELTADARDFRWKRNALDSRHPASRIAGELFYKGDYVSPTILERIYRWIKGEGRFEEIWRPRAAPAELAAGSKIDFSWLLEALRRAYFGARLSAGFELPEPILIAVAESEGEIFR